MAPSVQVAHGTSTDQPAIVADYGSQFWKKEIVDMPGFFDAMSDRSLRFDSAGNLHMVYGGDRLYYATFDGAQWHSEIVDPDIGTGTGASLDLDADDRPHISYLGLPNLELKYAHRSGGSWVLQVVDKAYPYQERTSIALDNDGRPHIAYKKFEPLPPDYSMGMGYASWTGSEWQIDRFTDTGSFVSLALDSAGVPHITFYNQQKILHAVKLADSWQIDEVGTSYYGYGSSVAVDSLDRPHVVHVDSEDNGQLIYAYWDGSQWLPQTVQPVSAGLNLSLVLDSADKAHIAYGNQYITLEGDGLDQPSSVNVVPGSFSSIALDGDGRPAISYYQSWGSLLYCQRLDDAEWIIDLVDWGGSSGWANSLGLDSNSEPQISYYVSGGGGGGAIRYAYRADNSWLTETITQTYIGSYAGSEYDTSLAVDGDDVPHASFWYSDYYSDGLYYAYRAGGDWQIEMIADDVDGPNDLALDNSDRPHVVFVDNGTLRYASRSAGIWTIQDVVESVSSHLVALALSEAGNPQIVYLDTAGASPVLTYAAWTDDGWDSDDIEVITAGQWVEATLTLDSSGKPHVAYVLNGEDEGELKYATRDGEIWVNESVDSRKWGIGQATILMGSDGNPNIVFPYRGIQLATRVDGQWQVQQAFDANASSDTSAAAGDGGLFVSYYDSRGHGLVLAGPLPLTEHVYLPSVLK